MKTFEWQLSMKCCSLNEVGPAFLEEKSSKSGVERGVATRRAQMVSPIMTVTVTNFEGFTRQQFWNLGIFAHFRKIHINFLQIFSKLLPSEALKICHSNCHHRPHHLSLSCGHTPFHAHII